MELLNWVDFVKNADINVIWSLELSASLRTNSSHSREKAEEQTGFVGMINKKETKA